MEAERLDLVELQIDRALEELEVTLLRYGELPLPVVRRLMFGN